MDTIERLDLDSMEVSIDTTGVTKQAMRNVAQRLGANHPMAIDDTLADMPEMDPANLERSDPHTSLLSEPSNPDTSISKYAQKKQRQLEKHQRAKNRDSIRSFKAVNEGDIEKHNKVSKRLYISKNHSEVTVVCEKTGIVSIMLIPGVQGRVLETVSVFASLSNARGLVQEGFNYLQCLDTQIVAGLFLTLASEYELVRYIPSATGVENNAILRTCGKDKLIEGCLLIERYIHSSNHTFLPKLSLIYEGELKETGCEGRFTEWMKLVNEAIIEPDLVEYDENALLNKPMRSIKDLQREHSKEQKELKRLSSLKDKNYKERAQFRKDMKEARSLIKGLANGESTKKLVGFLNSLFNEDTYLGIDTLLLGQVINKLEPMESASAKRIVEILKVDRAALRKELEIDDEDDPLFETVAPKAKDASLSVGHGPDTDEQDPEEGPTDEDIEQCAMEIEAEQSATEYFIAQAKITKQQEKIIETAVQVQRDDIVSPFAGLEMPPGLSLIQKIKWKRENAK